MRLGPGPAVDGVGEHPPATRVVGAPAHCGVRRLDGLAEVARDGADRQGRRPDLGQLCGGARQGLRETAYQFQRPYVLDSSAITRELGLEPTPWVETCRSTATNDVGDPVAS